MKFGSQLNEESVPQWGPHNIDYNELKHLIKRHTTKEQSKAIAIPGHDDISLLEFEEPFYKELCCQHDRIDLFVRSKAGELNRRLAHSQKEILRITSNITYGDGTSPTPRQLEKLEKYDRLIKRCKKDTQDLERFINAQRIAFRKILKKYKKWTGSMRLPHRFMDEKLDDPKSFTRRSLEPLYMQYAEANAAIRLVTPAGSPSDTPANSLRKSKARKQRERVRREQEARNSLSMQRGWNEYDDGSEGGDEEEPYLITVDANDTGFPSMPGIGALSNIYTRSSECLRSWFKAKPSRNTETSPLLSSDSPDIRHTADMSPDSRRGYSAISGIHSSQRTNAASLLTDTTSLSSADADDDASSTDIPHRGYATHYATFPSVADQHALKTAERLRSNITIGSFLVAFILLGISSMMLLVGKHKLRMEVDLGVIIGVVCSVIAAVCGMVSMVYREKVGWAAVGITVIAFVIDGIGAGVLLVVVMGNTAFWGKL